MNIERMKELKLEYGLSYDMISENTGVPISTIQKIFSGTSKAPRYKNLKVLQEYFSGFDEDHPQSGDMLMETEFRYGAGSNKRRWGIPIKKQGEYTLNDYYTVPDEYRIELIDGVIYDMASPGTIHQMIVSRLQIIIAEYIKKHNGKCVPYTAPLDVQLWPVSDTEVLNENDDHNCDVKDTVVQPDLMVICPSGKASLRANHIYGPPDLVMEVVSPSSGSRDTILKLDTYRKAGVREYWIIDPMSKRVLVYDFSSAVEYTIYGYHDKVPVGLYDGNLTIDFSEIDDYINSTFRNFGNEGME